MILSGSKPRTGCRPDNGITCWQRSTVWSRIDKVRIFIDGRPQKLKVNNGRLFRQFSDPGANLWIGAGGSPDLRFRGVIDEVRIHTVLPDAEQIAMLACADSLDRIASNTFRAAHRRAATENSQCFSRKRGPPSLQQLGQELRRLKEQRARLEPDFPTLMVMQELPEPRPAHILKRGAYDAPGEKVRAWSPGGPVVDAGGVSQESAGPGPMAGQP